MISRLWSAIDRAQRTRLFKIIASGIVVALAVVLMIVYSVAAAKARDRAIEQIRTEMAQVDAGQEAEKDETIITTRKSLENMATVQYSATAIASVIGLAALACLAVIWVDLGLTYLALSIACIIALLITWAFGGVKTGGPFIVGLFVLTASFSALVKLMAALLSASNPVTSIARNVLQEAVRMKVSLVFIVVMIFGLAALPLLLNENQPLRYRVQNFLQYGTSGSFMIIAVLVVLFSVMSVSGEQRTKQIWQTATKPVAAWQYVMGKWLGMAALSAALLGVSASGIFVFTEYLRRQPAIGEEVAFVPKPGEMSSPDRILLETQVLTSRQSSEPAAPDIDYSKLEEQIQAKVEQEMANLLITGDSPSELEAEKAKARVRIRSDLIKGVGTSYRTIPPGLEQTYVFTGLSEAKKLGKWLQFRYQIQSGGSEPNAVFKLTFAFPGVQAWQVVEAPMDQSLKLDLSPAVINDDGEVVMQVFNGDVDTRIPNARPFTFTSNGLKIWYASGTFTGNYFRLMVVLWIKLLFLSMVGVCTATFLSFPVAAMVSFTVFWAAEGTRFLTQALDSYQTTTQTGQTIWFNTIISYIAETITNVFATYGNLRPTTRLVEGEHLSWLSLAGGSTLVLLWCAALFALGVFIFKRRELAIYSGT